MTAHKFCVFVRHAHAIEPKYPGAFEQPINLCSCWDAHRLFLDREPVMALAAKISRCHEHCCRFLGAANSLLTDTWRIALECTSTVKTVKTAQRIAQAEFRSCGTRRGHEAVRFLSAVTNKGFVQFDDTVRLLCSRVYRVDDVYGASSRLLLNALRSAALEAGFDIITCYCPLSPFEKIEHLFVPALRLGFLTENEYHHCPVEPYKIVRARRFTDAALLKKTRKRVAFNKKAAAQMLLQAARLLADAKEQHDKLEIYYRGAMDFDKVDAVCEETLAQYRTLLQQSGK